MLPGSVSKAQCDIYALLVQLHPRLLGIETRAARLGCEWTRGSFTTQHSDLPETPEHQTPIL